MSEQKQQIYGFDHFQLDVPNRELLRDGQAVVLQAKAFDMLVVLIENAGRLVGKDELFSSVWPGQIVEESNLTVQVSAIRRALGEGKDNSHYIITVPGRGYRFTNEVIRLHQKQEELVIERHSHSRIIVERENGDAAEQNSVAPLDPSEFLTGRSETNVPANQATSEISVSARPTTSPVVARLRAQRRWLVAAVAAMVACAAIVVLYRYLQRAPAPPFQQITFKRLTSDGKAVNAALSPDGKLFAFVLGTKGNPRSLWLGHVSGGEPIALRPLDAVDYPTLKFSSDSNSLYYVITGKEYQRATLFRLPVFGGPPEKLRDDVASSIAFAPNMKQLVFVRLDRAKKISTLVVGDLEGRAERELATRSLDYRFLAGTAAWSPDGKTIAVGVISEDQGAPAHEVLLVTVADGRSKQLTKENYGEVGRVSWLNDRELLFIAVEHNLKDAQIWHVSLPGGEVRHLKSDLSSYEALDLSADGDSLLAIETQTLTNIWVAPAGKLDQAKKITSGTIGRREGHWGMDWTPAGQLVYAATEDKSETLWMMEADGSKPKQLTPAGYVDESPAASADGRFIVFQSNRSGNHEVWRVNADGNNLRQVTTGGNNEQPSVSPDGQWVVYVSPQNLSGERSGTLWRVALEGGAAMQISDGTAAWPRVSPDGQTIACEYSTRADPSQTKLALIPIAGGQPLQLFDLPPGVTFRYGLRWTPDGTAVTYRDWVNGIWRQPVAGGAPQRLAGLPEEKLFAYGWSPDGKQFAFTRGAETRDVVLMRNFR